MKQLILIFFLLPTLSNAAHLSITKAQRGKLENFIKKTWGPEGFIIPSLLNSEVISHASSENLKDNQQSLTTKVISMHPRTCRRGLKKISLYENYKSHISFLTESSYDDKTQMLKFVIEHTLLPYPMVLNFKIPRIHNAGSTEFQFDHGMFKGLQGKIEIEGIGNRCVYFLSADWKGQSTGLSPLVVEAFAQTLTKIGLEHLMRISNF
jgi:hypothetical protein